MNSSRTDRVEDRTRGEGKKAWQTGVQEMAVDQGPMGEADHRARVHTGSRRKNANFRKEKAQGMLK